MSFIDSVSVNGEIDDEWRVYIKSQQLAELDGIIAEEGLKSVETKVFIDQAFREGAIPTTGTAVTRILPSTSRFTAEGGHSEKKQRVLNRLGDFFDRFFGLTSGVGV